jgi:hypothetical protein
MNEENTEQDLREGLTERDLRLHPVCDKCHWRMGGPVDSWDGRGCKCGKQSRPFSELLKPHTPR